jgi:hypothetical protein
MEEIRNVYRNLMGKLRLKNMSLGKPRRIYDDIVKMDQRKTGYEDES